MIKFMHMADIHLDSPFEYLGDENKAKQRQLEQREIVKKTLLKAKEDAVDFVLISGDVLDGEASSVFTLHYLDDIIEQITPIPVILIAGNHDLYHHNTLLYTYQFHASNVSVLKKEDTYKQIHTCRIYSPFISPFETHLEDTFYNILMWHGDVNESGNENPLPLLLKNKGFDYIALGHVHQVENHSTLMTTIYYPGCLIARGFDELNEKGYLLVSVEDKKTTVSFHAVIQRKYREIKVDVTTLTYSSEFTLAEELKKYINDKNDLYKFVLIGNKKKEIPLQISSLLYELNASAYFIKIKDERMIKEISKSSPLQCLFLQKIEESIQTALTQEEKNHYLRVKQIGLKALENEVIDHENN